MALSSRHRVTAARILASVAFALLVAGCPSGGDATDEGADSAPPGPPCSRLTTKCEAGGKCDGAPDCASSLCRENVCKAVRPPDGAKNNDETDVDCGGTEAPACPDLKGCLANIDCNSGVCKGGVCQVPAPNDGVKNGDETGLDCGGAKPNAKGCPTGEGCLADRDCDKAKCDLTNKKCLAPTHSDGITNLDETGIDCGGPTKDVKRCEPGQGCVASADCNNVLCNTSTKKCDPPSKTDGLKNGTETDADCGGSAPTNAPKCLIDKKCIADTDCESKGCSKALGKCSPVSCATAETAGIVTCGAKEVGEAGAAHESCCKSLVLPTRTDRRLDKYEITSGRFRTFLTSVGPNVRAWVAAYAAANPASQLAKMLADFPVLKNLYPAVDRTFALSLTSHMALDIDNYNGVRGCANYAGSYSANTYWMDNTHYADYFLPPRSLPRTTSDEKSLNCAMPIMFTAFCAWDGGEVPIYDDYLDVWATGQPAPTVPANVSRPSFNWCNGTYKNGGFLCQCSTQRDAASPTMPADCPAGGLSINGVQGVFYEWPRGTDRAKDNSPLIAAPGRFVTDASAVKSGGESWYDLFANLAEYTGDFAANGAGVLSTFCDLSAAPLAGATTCTRTDPGPPASTKTGTLYTGIPQIGMLGRSWEGHAYNNTNKASTLPATFQYGKFGARCVRPAAPY